MVNLYLLTKHGPTHFSVSPQIFGLFEVFLNFLERMVKNWSIFEKTPFSLPSPAIPSLVSSLKPILNVKNITCFKYYIDNLYSFRFIFVSLQQFQNRNIIVKVCLTRYVPSIGMRRMHLEDTSIWRRASASRRCLSVSSVLRIGGSRMQRS